MRSILAEENIHPAIRDKVSQSHRDLVEEVKGAVEKNDVVVVGMSQNPFPKKARTALKDKGIAFKYLEYGSYLSQWRPRTALKMWSGWPTFPMVFVKGSLVGGFNDLKKLIDSGELSKLLA